MGAMLYIETVELPGTDVSSYLAKASAPFSIQPSGSLFQERWGSLFLRHCSRHYQASAANRLIKNTKTAVDLAQ